MDDDRYSAYFVSRRGIRPRAKRRKRRSHRAAGLLITVLIILTAAICLLVVFLPKLTSSTTTGGASPDFSGRTFYLLATAKVDARADAVLQAKSTAERGGAGYVYNDGSYHVVAALYERESDAKTLTTVNHDSYYFALSVPAVGCGAGDKNALEYVTGEFCSTLATAAAELDRGNITEAAAERAVSGAMNKLAELALNAENARLSSVLTSIADGTREFDRSVLSGLRYIQVSAIVEVAKIYA